LTAPKLEVLFAKFKSVGRQKKYVFDDDLLALVEEEGRDKAAERLSVGLHEHHLWHGDRSHSHGPFEKRRTKSSGSVLSGTALWTRRIAPWTKSPD
jgi:hypothetical protein